MRHNQNARRPQRGRNNGGGHGHGNGGGYNGGGNSGHHNNGQQGRRVNPRIQSFDSNGPDVRIRGTAYQINEKYVTLARDATSAGDRVLAESYLQHAEHYQRFINEMTEEYNQYQQQHQQQNPQQQPQPQMQPQVDGAAGAQVQANGAALNDLDQGFLVGPRHGGNGADVTAQPQVQQQNRPHHNEDRQPSPRRSEPEAV